LDAGEMVETLPISTCSILQNRSQLLETRSDGFG
jgi:hypothetical protein